MAITTQQKIDTAEKKLEALKSSIGEHPAGKEDRARLREAVKQLKRGQRRANIEKFAKSKMESQEASRLKTIQKAKEKIAKKKAAEESALSAAAEKQAEEEASSSKKESQAEEKASPSEGEKEAEDTAS